MGTRQQEGFRQRLQAARSIRTGTNSLNGSGSSVETTLPIDAVRKHGIDEDDPGDADWIWMKDLGVLVFDLEGEFTHSQPQHPDDVQ